MTLVDVNSLSAGDSPRLNGQDGEHTKALAQVEGPLPPILVRRSTMRVVDGMHRLQAVQLRGAGQIEVRFFEGSEEEAFVLAVESNIAHGLPLTLSDRTFAAIRILGANAMWSDRVIAQKTGLAPGTVSRIRARATDDSAQSNSRLGRDGRLRPLNGAIGRRKASLVIKEKPEASLREIARDAGISPATVRDVQARLERGEDPVPPRNRAASQSNGRPGRPAGQCDRQRDETDAGPEKILGRLRLDPSLRYSEAGRELLTWLSARVPGAGTWRGLSQTVPAPCTSALAALARGCAESWASFADELEGAARAGIDLEAGGTVPTAASRLPGPPGLD